MTRISRFFAAALALLIATPVVTTPARAQDEAAPLVTVSGQLTYRQRIALPPNSTATVTLQDISRADAPAQVLGRASFPARQVPIPFELSVAGDLLDPRHRYSLGAAIHDAGNTLLWISDTVIPVDPAQARTEAGTITLVQVAAAPSPTPEALTGGEWRVEDIGGRGVIDTARTTIAFDEQGRITGSGGCNSYSGSYELAGDVLTFGPVAATRKACVPAVSDQEHKFFTFLNAPLTVTLTETGALVLTDPQGRSLTARR